MGTGRRARCGLGPVAAVLPLLNPRQQKACATILARGRITRDGYQEAIDGDLPVRTAIYDLQGLVRKSVLKKTVSGPATAYVADPRFTGWPAEFSERPAANRSYALLLSASGSASSMPPRCQGCRTC